MSKFIVIALLSVMLAGCALSPKKKYDLIYCVGGPYGGELFHVCGEEDELNRYITDIKKKSKMKFNGPAF